MAQAHGVMSKNKLRLLRSVFSVDTPGIVASRPHRKYLNPVFKVIILDSATHLDIHHVFTKHFPLVAAKVSVSKLAELTAELYRHNVTRCRGEYSFPYSAVRFVYFPLQPL